MLLVKLHYSCMKEQQRHLFALAILMNQFFMLTEIVWIFIDGTENTTLNWILNILYFCIATSASYVWYLFSQYGSSKKANMKSHNYLAAIPLILILTLALTTPIHHLLFYIDANNSYVRGPLYFLQVITSYGYLIISSILSYFTYRSETNYQNKKRAKLVHRGILTTILAGIIQILYPTLLTLCIGTTLSFLYIYLGYQEIAVSKDALTALNNRNATYNHLNTISKYATLNQSIYVSLITITDLKQINETYGHLEGDHVLIDMANILKNATIQSSDFIARVNNAKFILIHDTSNDADPSYFKDYLLECINKTKVEHPFNYTLDYFLFSGNIEEFTSFIKQKTVTK